MESGVLVFILNTKLKLEFLKLIIAVCLMLLTFACTPSADRAQTSNRRVVKLSVYDCFENVLRLELANQELAAYSPSTITVKGVFGENDEIYVLYDYRLKECIIYNLMKEKVESTFEIPKHDGWGESHLLEVISLDSILYFDFEHQSLVTCNTEEVVRVFNLKFGGEHHHPYLIIQHLHKFLRSIDGYIGFNTWINYGEGGYDKDYDALMDERNMVSFFKVHEDSVIIRDIPIKPYLRKTAFPDLMYVDDPYFEVNSQSREVLVFHVTTDTIYTYDWDNEQIVKHVVSGSETKLVPPKVPRKGSSADVVATYENQERGYHRIYIDHQSGKYLRLLVKEFPTNTVNGIPPQPDIRLLQVLNDNFEVEAEMELPKGYELSNRVKDAIYLRKFDDELREFVLLKFDGRELSRILSAIN